MSTRKVDERVKALWTLGISKSEASRMASELEAQVEAFGNRPRRVLFISAADLVRDLLKAREQRRLGRLQKRLLKQDLLLVDELGLVPFDRAGGEMLFDVLSER